MSHGQDVTNVHGNFCIPQLSLTQRDLAAGNGRDLYIKSSVLEDIIRAGDFLSKDASLLLGVSCQTKRWVFGMIGGARGRAREGF